MHDGGQVRLHAPDSTKHAPGKQWMRKAHYQLCYDANKRQASITAQHSCQCKSCCSVIIRT